MSGPARVAVVGDATSVAGFRTLGFAAFPVERAADARDLWDDLAGGEYAIVFVTEPVYAEIADLVASVADRATPAVTVVPGTGSPGGVGEAKLSAAIERALGTKVLMREDA